MVLSFSVFEYFYPVEIYPDRQVAERYVSLIVHKSCYHLSQSVKEHDFIII